MSTIIYRIYKVTNLNNHKLYIGWTNKPCVEDRLKAHINSANHGSEYHFHRAIRKHGPLRFQIEQIDQCYDKDEKNRLEKYWIAHYNTFLGEGYNMTEGGEGGGYNHPRPEHEKIQISESLTGLKRPRISCLKCKTEGSINHFKRYHGENCGNAKKRKTGRQADFTCPTCGVTGGASNMKRFHGEHGEKCKDIKERNTGTKPRKDVRA